MDALRQILLLALCISAHCVGAKSTLSFGDKIPEPANGDVAADVKTSETDNIKPFNVIENSYLSSSIKDKDEPIVDNNDIQIAEESSHVPVTVPIVRKRTFVRRLDSSANALPFHTGRIEQHISGSPINIVSSHQPANIASTRHLDGSYQFRYSGDNHGREEARDVAGNVVGSYRYVADDNQEREVTYTASPQGGFEASGAGILNVPSLIQEIRAVRGPYVEPEYPAHWADMDRSYNFAYHAGDSARNEQSDQDGNVYGFYTYLDDQGVQQTVHYEAGVGGFRVLGDNIPHGISSDLVTARDSIPQLELVARPTPRIHDPSNLQISYAGDGSYSFDYEAAGHRRTESADGAGNVGGSFSFIGDDNVNRQVDYSAGAGQGFRAHGAHLPRAGVTAQTTRTVVQPQTVVRTQAVRPQAVRTQTVVRSQAVRPQAVRTQTVVQPHTVVRSQAVRPQAHRFRINQVNRGQTVRGGQLSNIHGTYFQQPHIIGVGGSRLYDYSTSYSTTPGSFYYQRNPATTYSYNVGYPREYHSTSFPQHHETTSVYQTGTSNPSSLYPGYQSVTLPGGVAYSTGLKHFKRDLSDEVGVKHFKRDLSDESSE